LVALALISALLCFFLLAHHNSVRVSLCCLPPQ
jgi:hypothetical protein